MRRLQYIPQACLQPKLAALAIIPPVDEHLSLRRLIEPANEVHDGALACTRFAHKGNGFSSVHMQTEIAQHLFAAFISERNVFKLHFALDFFPVFAFRIEAVPVFCNNLRRIDDLARRIDQRNHALRACLRALKLCKNPRKLLHRLKEVHRIRDER